MKKIISILFGLALVLTARAHDTMVASFTIYTKPRFVEVYADLPWTLRNALLEFEPLLEEQKDQEFWDKTLKAYFEANLKIWTQKGEPLELLYFEKLDNEGHDHAAQYLITYDNAYGAAPGKVKNTILFAQSEHQVNNHFFKENSRSISFKTTRRKPEVFIDKEGSNENDWLWALFFIGIVSSHILLSYLEGKGIIKHPLKFLFKRN